MNKALFVGFLLLIFTSSHAQSDSFQVAPFFTVSLPTTPDSMETDGVKVYMLNTDSIYYQVGFDSKILKVKTKKDYDIAISGMYHGFKSKLDGFEVRTTDTVINGKEGLFAFAVSKYNPENARQLFLFFTLINGHCCFVQCSTLMETPAQKGVESFFHSVRFKGENYPVKQESNIAFFIGQLLGYALVAVVVFFLVRFITLMVIGKKK
ncbi:MAG: hypothetical protein EOO14_21950 [Chitinophagaceae bacterium]|nr:MAG: hypothetical protein EOO14_21950 [Chitinophagaceae bacterium]